MTDINLSENEIVCLKAFTEDLCYPFYYIADIANLTIPETRQVVRALAAKGLVAFSRGLMSDEGKFAGAGYGLTTKGHDMLAYLHRSNLLEGAL